MIQAKGAYGLIKKALKLRWVKDNIFVDSRGRRLYLDRYGFHTANQYANMSIHEIEEKKKQLTHEIEVHRKYKQKYTEKEKQFVGMGKLAYMKEVIHDSKLSDLKKVIKLRDYINKEERKRRV